MKRARLLLCIALSFVAASALNVYPLGFALAAYRPMTLLLVLIFWAIYEPRYVGVGVAFAVGLAADLLLDTRLGHQAFCAVAAVFAVQILSVYSKKLDFVSSWIVAAAALGVYRVLLWALQLFVYGLDGLTGAASFALSVLFFPLFWWPLFYARRRIDPSAF